MKHTPLIYRPGIPLPLLRTGLHACPYLPDRTASDLVVLTEDVDAAMYQRLMDDGFRRSGPIFYRPDCPGCRECVQIRVPAAAFAPSRSQRRVLRRNGDVTVEIGRPSCDDERYAMFERYQAHQHERAMLGSREEYEMFFCHSPIKTLEMTYRVAGRLIGVGLVDVTPQALSSVYFYFDPDEARRSPGVFSALCEIAECRRRELPHWYMGFYVRDCAKMNYKANYRPHELLGPDGTWSPATPFRRYQ